MRPARPAMPTCRLPGGERVPRFGIGTWRMGEDAGKHARELAAVRLALDEGVTLIDTAEMYGEGGAEKIVGEAIHGRRDALFIVSKVYPHNAGRRTAIAACERSLARLRTDRIDLYLLHWRGNVPLADTVEAFEKLRAAGKIRHWGVSNLDTADMRELARVEGGKHVVANQVLYNVAQRAPEWSLLPYQREQGIVTMAYSPLDQGPLAADKTLARIGARHGASAAQVALAWLLAMDDVITIPKSSDPTRLRENLDALGLLLDTADRAAIDKAFPKPNGPKPIAVY